MCWRIWSNRNGEMMVFREDATQRSTTSHELDWDFCTQYLQDFKAARENLHYGANRGRSSTSRPLTWKPPDGNNVKINTDAAVNLVDKRCGIGGIVRNQDGEAMFSFCRSIEGVLDAEIVEALAVREGLEMAVELGFRRIEVETDALRVAHLLQKHSRCRTEVGRIVDETLGMAVGLNFISFSWCGRSSNSLAHKLSRMAAMDNLNQQWMEDVPDEIRGVYFQEANQIPNPYVGDSYVARL